MFLDKFGNTDFIAEPEDGKKLGYRVLDQWVHHKMHQSIYYLGNDFIHYILDQNQSAVILFVKDENSPTVKNFELAATNNKVQISFYIKKGFCKYQAFCGF